MASGLPLPLSPFSLARPGTYRARALARPRYRFLNHQAHDSAVTMFSRYQMVDMRVSTFRSHEAFIGVAHTMDVTEDIANGGAVPNVAREPAATAAVPDLRGAQPATLLTIYSEEF